MQSAAKRLPAHEEGSLSKQLQHHKRATPARAQPTVLRGRVLFDQRLDPLVHRLIQKRSRASLLAIEKGCLPFSQETLDDRVNGVVREQKRTRAIRVGE